ncbi:MAG: ABC transporter permease [Gemmatimonadales bacterium]|nr:ABC transporter permease [Gemmatimonadales bacterium]
MTLVTLALRSLGSRRVPTALTICSVALGVAMLAGVDLVRRGARAAFDGALSGTDLVVGARGAPQALVLGTVYGIGQPQGTLSPAAQARIAAHPAVAWTAPVALGDNVRGLRVLGTTPALLRHWRYRGDRTLRLTAGDTLAGPRDAVLGATAAATLGRGVGDTLTLAHGLLDSDLAAHEGHPLRVAGVLAPTGTPLDRTVLVTLDGLAQAHEDGLSAPVAPGTASALLVGLRARRDALRLKAELERDIAEPLTAALPGLVLAQFWRDLGVFERTLELLGAAAVLLALLGMLAALLTALDGRRRELAVFRALGARPATIVTLLLLEACCVSVLGSAAGLGVVYLGAAAAGGAVERAFGVPLAVAAPDLRTLATLAAIVAAGTLAGLWPAWRAYRTSLADGLVTRT